MSRTTLILALMSIAASTVRPAYAEPIGVSPVAFDIAELTPYAFNTARLSCRNGFSGPARVFGVGLDGERYLLFETRLGYADSINVRFYAWPQLASLSFEGNDGDGLAVVALTRLRLTGFGDIAEIEPEVAALSALEFPFRLTPLGPRRQTIPAAEFLALSPEAAARWALSYLFATSRRAPPLAAMTLWTVAVIAFAARPKIRRNQDTAAEGVSGRPLVAALVLVVCAASIVTYALGRAPAELYSLPIRNQFEKVEDEDHDLVCIRIDSGDYVSISWATVHGDEPGLRLIGVRSPLSAAVPVSTFKLYRRIRFRRPPLVVREAAGDFLLAPAPFMTAWGLHE